MRVEPALRGHLVSFRKLLAEVRFEEDTTISKARNGPSTPVVSSFHYTPRANFDEWLVNIDTMIATKPSRGDKLRNIMVGQATREGVSQRMILHQNSFAIPAADMDFLPKQVDPIDTTRTKQHWP
jgi:hypothetical protein